MIKPLKERLQIYRWLFFISVALTVVLLFTGYDYRRNKGFFTAVDRESMNLGEVLAAFPSEYIYILLVLVGIVALLELVIFVCQRIFRRS